MKYLLVFAHPDDETFTSGGTISLLTKEGHVVNLICATKGEAGLLGNSPVATRQNLGKVRESELRNAAKIIGIKNIYFLGLIDGTLRKTGSLTNKILELYLNDEPDVIITFDKTGVSNHPDHIAIGLSATNAYKHYQRKISKPVKLYHTAVPQSKLKKLYGTELEYKVFGRIVGTPDEQITTKIEITKYTRIKIKAMEMYKTQNKDMESFLKREPDINFEYFRLVEENAI